MQRLLLKRQRTAYYCGPAVIQAVLHSHGISRSQDTIAQHAHTNKRVGTSVRSLVQSLRSWGMSVTGGDKQTLKKIQTALKKGFAVIVCYTETDNDEGHYALVSALSRNTITLLDPAEQSGVAIFSTKEFLSRWCDPLYTHSTRFAAYIS